MSYAKLDGFFQELLRKITAGENFSEDYKALADDLIKTMKKLDPIFRSLYKGIHETGSSFEGLWTGHKDEFDLNVILSLPVGNEQDFEIQNAIPGHLKIKMKLKESDYEKSVSQKFINEGMADCKEKIIRTLKSWWEAETLQRQLVLQWFQSSIDKTLTKMRSLRNSLPGMKNVETIERKMSGPAATIVVKTKGGQKFSMDMVPSFAIQSDRLINGPAKQKVESLGIKVDLWYLIPKAPKAILGDTWRYSLWDHELELIKDNEHFKPVIRILKHLRDIEGWSILASYYIKSVMMHLLTKDPSVCRRGLAEGVVIGLKALRECLHQANIPFLWDGNLNMILNLDRRGVENMSNRLRVIIESFDFDDRVDPKLFFDGNKAEVEVLSSQEGRRCRIITDLNTSVDGFKHQLQEKAGLRPEGQTLLHMGKTMSPPNSSIRSHGIRHGCRDVTVCRRNEGG